MRRLEEIRRDEAIRGMRRFVKRLEEIRGMRRLLFFQEIRARQNPEKKSTDFETHVRIFWLHFHFQNQLFEIPGVISCPKLPCLGGLNLSRWEFVKPHLANFGRDYWSVREEKATERAAE